MKQPEPECAHCGLRGKLGLYWSTKNLLKIRLKTYYCGPCARIVGDSIKLEPALR